MNGRDITSFNLPSTWGTSLLRDSITTIGAGAAIIESYGHIKLSTGTATGNVVQLTSLERAQYLIGTEGDALIGIHLTALPSGTQTVEWGYDDRIDGLGFGIDALGSYVYRRIDGLLYKTRQEEWPNDRMDGTGPSRITLDLKKHNTFRVIFDHTALRFIIQISDADKKQSISVEVATIITSGVAISNPNQPITVYATNGQTSTSNLNVFVAGRSYRTMPQDANTPSREVSEILSNYTIPTAQNVWHPLIAIRRKSTQGLSTKPNSIKVRITGVDLGTDNSVEYKITVGTGTSGGVYSTPTDWTSEETAVETKIQAGALLAADGIPLFRSLVWTEKKIPRSTSNSMFLPLESTKEAVLWARRTTSDETIISTILKWKELW